jgi:hypothetical protein
VLRKAKHNKRIRPGDKHAQWNQTSQQSPLRKGHPLSRNQTCNYSSDGGDGHDLEDRYFWRTFERIRGGMEARI